MRRVLDRATHPEKYASKPLRLEPESRFIVRVSDSEVVCERPDGRTERISWSDLQKMEVITTDEGPFTADVFWVLHGTSSGCVIPQGATGDAELLKHLQALPHFDNNVFTEAQGSTSNQTFICWERHQHANHEA
jgi:hypothetical protein